MNEQQLAILMQLLGGQGIQSNQLSNIASPGSINPGLTDVMNSPQADNAGIMSVLGGSSGQSSINTNPNYASTVNRFFNQNPLAGNNAFFGASPLQAGNAGNNAVRARQGWSSFAPPPHNSIDAWTGA